MLIIHLTLTMCFIASLSSSSDMGITVEDVVRYSPCCGERPQTPHTSSALAYFFSSQLPSGDIQGHGKKRSTWCHLVALTSVRLMVRLHVSEL